MALVPANIKAAPSSHVLALEDLRGRIETMKTLLTTDYKLLEKGINQAELREGKNEKLVLIPYNKGHFEVGCPHLGGVHLPLPFVGVNVMWRSKSKQEFVFEMARRYQVWSIEMSTFFALRFKTKRSFFKPIIEDETLTDAVREYYEKSNEAKQLACPQCLGERKELGICCINCYTWSHLSCVGIEKDMADPDTYLCSACVKEGHK